MSFFYKQRYYGITLAILFAFASGLVVAKTDINKAHEALVQVAKNASDNRVNQAPTQAPNQVITPVTDQIDTADYIVTKQPLTIAINKTSFPYHSADEQGQAIGLMVDMWRLWAKKQQVTIKFVLLPWLETLTEVANGNVDIHGGLVNTSLRQKTLQFSQSLLSIYTHLYIHKQLNTVSSLTDLTPYSIGVVQRSVHLEGLQKKHPELALKIYDSYPDLYQAALNNEVLVFAGLEKITPDYNSLKEHFPLYKLMRYQQGDYGVAVAKNKQGLLHFINQGFAKISLQERNKIEQKWLGLAKPKNSLLIAFPLHYPPYMGVSPSGKPQGLLIDVWRLWSKQVGINVDFIAQDMADALAMTAAQKVDVLLAYPEHNRIAQNTLFTNTIYSAQAQVFINNNIKDVEGNNVESLEQFTQNFSDSVIGIWIDSTVKAQILANYPELTIRYFNNVNAMFIAAEQNEIAGMVGLSDLVKAKLVQENLQTHFYLLDNPTFTVKLAPVIHQKNAKLAQVITAGFNDLNMTALMNIEDKWLTDNKAKTYYRQQANKVVLNDAEQAFLASNKSITLGFIDDLSPIEFSDENDEFSGINRDIINLVSERTDIEFDFVVFTSWAKLYDALLTNKIDIIASTVPTSEREERMLFSESYWKMPWVMLHPLYTGRQKKLEDFQGKQVAIVKGYHLNSWLRQTYPLIAFKMVDNREQALIALQQERVDGFFTSVASATYLLKQENILTLMMSVMDDVNIDNSHFAINKNMPLLKSIIDKGLVSITEKEKQTIYDNWFTLAIETGLDKSVVLQIALQVAVITLLVIGVILLRNRRLKIEIKHRQQLEKIMKHMATHDELTGLANRVLLKDRLSTAISFHQRQSLKMAILFIDLDGFKNINDSHGHDVGDELLKQVAERLQGCVRTSDTVVRFGGDEFVLLLTGLHSSNEAAYVAEKVLRLMQKEFELSKAKASIGCSIGIAMYPSDGDNNTELLKVADTLMYKVKAAGKNHYIFN